MNDLMPLRRLPRPINWPLIVAVAFTAGFTLGAALVVIAAGWASLDVSASNEKVTICHKNKNTLTVASPAVPAHLSHGDTVGACSASPKT